MIEVDWVEYGTRAELAQTLGTTIAAVRSWERRGILEPAAKVRGRVVYRLRDAVEAEHLIRSRENRRRAGHGLDA